MDILPATRFIQAAAADNAKVAQFLLEQEPECRNYIVHAICSSPNPKSECFQFLMKEAAPEQLLEVEKELKTLVENSGDSRRIREAAEYVRDTVRRERTRRVLKPNQTEPDIQL